MSAAPAVSGCGLSLVRLIWMICKGAVQGSPSEPAQPACRAYAAGHVAMGCAMAPLLDQHTDPPRPSQANAPGPRCRRCPGTYGYRCTRWSRPWFAPAGAPQTPRSEGHPRRTRTWRVKRHGGSGRGGSKWMPTQAKSAGGWAAIRNPQCAAARPGHHVRVASRHGRPQSAAAGRAPTSSAAAPPP